MAVIQCSSKNGHHNRLKNGECLKFIPKWSLSYFQPILAAIFDIIATVTVIVKIIPDFNTSAIVLINQ